MHACPAGGKGNLQLIFVDRWVESEIVDLHEVCFDVLILVVMASDLANCYCDFSKSY